MAMTTFLIVGLLLTSSNAASYSESGELVDQLRPDVIYKTKELLLNHQMTKGNDTNNIDLLYTQTGYYGRTERSAGFGDIELSNDSFGFAGDVNRLVSVGYRQVVTFHQNDAYIENAAVGERVTRSTGDRNTWTNSITINETMELPASFSDLQANTNYTEVERDGYTVFWIKQGVVRVAPFNDTNGEFLANIIGFRVNIHFFVFNSDTQDFVGAHSVTESGYGNYLPRAMITYLTNSSIVQSFENTAAGARLFAAANSSTVPIQWISLGYNDTYGLNTYYAGFQFHKVGKTFLVTPKNLGGPQTEAVPLGVEELIVDLESSLSYAEPSDEEIEALNVEAVEQVDLTSEFTTDDPLNLPDTTDDQLDLRIFFAGQALALIVVAVFIVRRFKVLK